MQQHPVATKRALRALEPERAARFMVEKGYGERYDHALALERLKDLSYNQWR
jgi:hypothetical protein